MTSANVLDCRTNRVAAAIGGALLIAASASTVSSAAFAATITVSNCDDTGPGSLRAAIIASTDGSTIDLSKLGCSTITLASGELFTGNSLTLHGAGPSHVVTIDANLHSRILEHSGAQLTIYGLDFSNGLAAGSGGCIRSSGNVSIDRSNFHFCEAENEAAIVTGGALSVSGNLTLARTQLLTTECLGAKSYGGSIYVNGDFVMRDSSVEGGFTNSHLTGLRSFGGGIFAKGKVDISNSAIVSNQSGVYSSYTHAQYTGNGGGIVVSSPDAATVKIVNSTISGNFAAGKFGGLYSNAPLTLANSTVANNTELDWDYSTVGAGISLFNTTGYLSSSIIFGNNAYAPNEYFTRYTCCYEEDIDGPSMTVTGSHNLVGYSLHLTLPPGTVSADPLLGPLGSHGGPTKTQVLNPGSPAIAAGDNLFGLVTDQRGPGFARVFARHVDIGAFQSGDAIFAAPFDPGG